MSHQQSASANDCSASPNVSITIAPRSLMLWNTEMKQVTEPGTFTIMTGSNSAEVQSVTLTVAE